MPPSAAAHQTPVPPWPPVLALALLLLGSRLLLIALFGNATPSWDQWEAEANQLYAPLITGQLGWRDLLAPCNEHRIFATRMLDLLLLTLNNGVWNCLLQMVAGACLQALALGYLLHMLRAACPPERRPLFLGLALALLLIPFGWENVLWGFQSQFYFFLLFSFLFIGAATRLQPFSGLWWLGLLCGPLSVLSLAGGVITLAVGALLIGARALRADQRAVLPVAAALLGLALLAYAATPVTRLSEPYRAHSPAEFLAALNSVMSWPLLPFSCVVIQWPLLRFLFQQGRRPPPEGDPSWLLFGLGLWLLAQFAGIAYSRAPLVLSSRYQDILVLGLVLNVLCLIRQFRPARFRYRFYQLWLIVVVLGICLEAPDLIAAISYRGSSGLAQEARLRDFLAAPQPALLTGRPAYDIPFASTTQLQLFLENPAIRQVLPGNILPANEGRQPWLLRQLVRHLGALAVLSLLAGLGVLLRRRPQWLATGQTKGAP